VRRSFLCRTEGGKCYEHRRQWLIDRIRLLSSLFAIDICSYAVMSNHYHIALKPIPEQVDDWTDDEVIRRWLTLFKGHVLVQHYVAGIDPKAAERDKIKAVVAEWRWRLSNISWFMKCPTSPLLERQTSRMAALATFGRHVFAHKHCFQSKRYWHV